MGFIQRISDALVPRDPPRQAIPQTSPFDSIREFDGDGNEFWSARKLMKFMGYAQWQNFVSVVGKAIEAVANDGYQPGDHFMETHDEIPTGKGARIAVDDVHLDRFACYHVALAGDPSKTGVAAARSYFVIQTRRAEVRDAEERQASKIGRTAAAAQKMNGLDHHWALTRQDAVDISKLIAHVIITVLKGDGRLVAGCHNAIMESLTGMNVPKAKAALGIKGTPLNHLETLPLTLRNSLGAAIAQGVADGSITLDNAGEKVEALARSMLSMPRALYGNYEVATSVSPTGQKLLGYRPAIKGASGSLKQLHN